MDSTIETLADALTYLKQHHEQQMTEAIATAIKDEIDRELLRTLVGKANDAQTRTTVSQILNDIIE